MKTVERYLEKRWTALIGSVKENFNALDVSIDNGICRDSWESFAWLLRCEYPQVELYKDAANVQCSGACDELSEFEVGALLAWRWNDYLDLDEEPGVEEPWELSPAAQRRALAAVLHVAVLEAAANDGEAVYDRQWAAEEPKDEATDEAPEDEDADDDMKISKAQERPDNC